jgi:hypothetical protein
MPSAIIPSGILVNIIMPSVIMMCVIMMCVIMLIVVPSGLYYKHVTIVNDESRVISNWSLKLIDDAWVVNYDHNMFIIQATGYSLLAYPQAAAWNAELF